MDFLKADLESHLGLVDFPIVLGTMKRGRSLVQAAHQPFTSPIRMT